MPKYHHGRGRPAPALGEEDDPPALRGYVLGDVPVAMVIAYGRTPSTVTQTLQDITDPTL
jgi:hypothetical protein